MRFSRPVMVTLMLAAAAAGPALAQQGAFVVRLGRDTTAVEQFTRTATHLEGDGVLRAPRTALRHFAVDFGPNGQMTRAEVVITRPGAPAGAAPVQRAVVTFMRDSAVVEVRRDTAVQTRRIAVPSNAVPVIAGAASSWVAFELMVARLRASHSDSLAVPVYNIGAGAAGTWSIKPLGRDSVWLYDANDVFHAKIDRDGRIVGAVPLSGTQQFTVTRVASLDLNALGTAFAARDTQGQSLGLLSPRDTVRASVAGASLLVDYSRPAKRGRVIFGSTIVPWGEVWRVGANAATQFRTDKALEMGGVVVPAGFYTLWAIPAPDGWRLLINSQTGQWGTAHDGTKDLFQLPMASSTLPQPVERFTINVVSVGQGGVLQLDWDTIRASMPFSVR
jgi:hypothetical protein